MGLCTKVMYQSCVHTIGFLSDFGTCAYLVPVENWFLSSRNQNIVPCLVPGNQIWSRTFGSYIYALLVPVNETNERSLAGYNASRVHSVNVFFSKEHPRARTVGSVRT